jgi:hypothetical protein
MPLDTRICDELRPESSSFYCNAVQTLKRVGLPFMLGGAYALNRYAGIIRHTKDLDLFVKPEQCTAVLGALEEAGYRTEITDPVWLGKAFHGEDFVDVIYGSGKGTARVDEEWFAHAVPDEVLGEQVLLIPAEEMLWSKAFVVERERYDGADIAHLIRARGAQMDWTRLLRRFGPHWRVLYSYLVLFGFAYPGERTQVPDWLLDELAGRMQQERTSPPPPERICNGTFLSVAQYRVDIDDWGYTDGRLLFDNVPPAAG